MKLTSSQIKKLQNYFAREKDILAVYLYGSFAKRYREVDLNILATAATVGLNDLRSFAKTLNEFLGKQSP